jgi:hypothetical protein
MQIFEGSFKLLEDPRAKLNITSFSPALDIIDDPTYSRLNAQTNEVKRMLHGLTQYLVSNSARNPIVPR